MIDHGGVIDGVMRKASSASKKDLILSDIGGGFLNLLPNGVEIVQLLNSLVSQHGYCLLFHSKNKEIDQLELLARLQQACTKRGLVFPRVEGMAVFDASQYPGISSEHPECFTRNGIKVAGYGIEQEGKSCVRQALRALCGSPSAEQHIEIVFDDGPSVIEKAKHEGCRAYRIGEERGTVSLLNALREVMVSERRIAEQERRRVLTRAVTRTTANTDIIKLCSEGDIAKVRALVRKHPKAVMQRSEIGETALYATCAGGHVNVLAFLINDTNAAQDIETAMMGGYRPLHIAADGGHIDTVRLLVEKGAQYNALDDNKRTPLYCACRFGRVQVVEYLLSLDGVNLQHRDNKGQTALYVACREGHMNIVTHLLRRDPTLATIAANDGTSPLAAAQAGGHEEIIKLLSKSTQSTLAPTAAVAADEPSTSSAAAPAAPSP